MKEWWRAIQTSRRLDGARGRDTDDVPESQARIHRILSDRRGVPWEAPSRGLRARIEHDLDTGDHSPIPLELPWLRPIPWGSVAAAGLVLAACVSAGIIAANPSLLPFERAGDPGATPPPLAVSTPDDALIAVGSESMTRFATDAGPLAASTQQPLVREVENLRKDTERAIGAVFSRLPLFDPD
jgi:hypothetical protein